MSEQQTSQSNQAQNQQTPETIPEGSKLLTWLILIMELIFVFFPFLVYIFVLIQQKRGHLFFSLSEWGFAATLLFGQAMVKFLLGILSGPAPKTAVKPAFVMILIFMFGFVPSFLILIFVLLNSEGGNHPAPGDTAMFPNGWVVAQLVMFVIAVAAYLYFGGAGEYWRQVNEAKRRSTEMPSNTV